MLKYVKPIVDSFSIEKSLLGDSPYSTCKSHAPTNGCYGIGGTICNDGNSNRATCESTSSECNNGDVTVNSLCSGTEECECSSTGSTFNCTSGTI